MVRRPGEARHIQLKDVVGQGTLRQATSRLEGRSQGAQNRQCNLRGKYGSPARQHASL